MEAKTKETEERFSCNWDDSDWWTIYRKTGERHEVWLCIEGQRDDIRATEIVAALNEAPALSERVRELESEMNIRNEREIEAQNTIMRQAEQIRNGDESFTDYQERQNKKLSDSEGRVRELTEENERLKEELEAAMKLIKEAQEIHGIQF